MKTNLPTLKGGYPNLNEADLSRRPTVKKMIVREDPFEKGVHSVLNFGHAIGHRIERSKITRFSHGKAVPQECLSRVIFPIS